MTPEKEIELKLASIASLQSGIKTSEEYIRKLQDEVDEVIKSLYPSPFITDEIAEVLRNRIREGWEWYSQTEQPETAVVSHFGISCPIGFNIENTKPIRIQAGHWRGGQFNFTSPQQYGCRQGTLLTRWTLKDIKRIKSIMADVIPIDPASWDIWNDSEHTSDFTIRYDVNGAFQGEGSRILKKNYKAFVNLPGYLLAVKPEGWS